MLTSKCTFSFAGSARSGPTQRYARPFTQYGRDRRVSFHPWATRLRRRNLSLDIGLCCMFDSAVFHEAAHPVNIIKLVKRNLFQWVFLPKCYSFVCATWRPWVLVLGYLYRHTAESLYWQLSL